MTLKQELENMKYKPRLDTVLMVENTIEKYSGEYTKFQIWRKLPKSIMYQTFQTIIAYLQYSNKIAFDKKGKIGWIFNPGLYKKYSTRKDLSR